MVPFDPLSALFGGALIGLASVLLMVLTGRIAGISGIFGGLVTMGGDKGWRLAFIAGLIVAPLLSGLAGYPLPMPQMPDSWATIVVAGLLVGFGARLVEGVDTVEEVLSPEMGRRHLDEALDMDRGDDGLLRPICLAAAGLHADTAAVLHDQRPHQRIGDYRPTVLLDDGDDCPGETRRPSHRYRPASPLSPRGQRVDEMTRAR